MMKKGGRGGEGQRRRRLTLDSPSNTLCMCYRHKPTHLELKEAAIATVYDCLGALRPRDLQHIHLSEEEGYRYHLHRFSGTHTTPTTLRYTSPLKPHHSLTDPHVVFTGVTPFLQILHANVHDSFLPSWHFAPGGGTIKAIAKVST